VLYTNLQNPLESSILSVTTHKYFRTRVAYTNVFLVLVCGTRVQILFTNFNYTLYIKNNRTIRFIPHFCLEFEERSCHGTQSNKVLKSYA
jgi:hypothetical protein